MMRALSCAAALVLAAASVQAEDALATLELNTVEQRDQTCRITFTARAPQTIDKLVTETVLFDTNGTVSLFTLFDFGELPEQKFRVRQFDLPGTECASVGRILFNGVDTCAGAACESAPLSVGSRLESVEVLG